MTKIDTPIILAVLLSQKNCAPFSKSAEMRQIIRAWWGWQAKFLSLELGFWIPIVRGIPDSTYKNSPESEFPYMPGRHWPLAKPTDKHQYLPHLSGHPIHTKRAIPLNLYRICWTNKTASHSAQKNYLAISKNVSGLQPLFRPSTGNTTS